MATRAIPISIVVSVLALAALAWWGDGRASSHLTEAHGVDGLSRIAARAEIESAVSRAQPIESSSRSLVAVKERAPIAADPEPEATLEELPAAPDPPPVKYRVTFRGRILDTDDQPIPHAILLAQTNDDLGAPPTAAFPVKLDGSYEFVDFEVSESVRWSVKATGFTTRCLGWTFPEHDSEVFDEGDVQLLEGEARVTGVVTDLDGRPARGVAVGAYVPGGGCSPSRTIPESATLTDERGVFRLDGLPVKTAFVKCTKNDAVDPRCAIEPVQFDASRSADLRIRLRALRRFCGTALAPDGSPLPGARVVITTSLTIDWKSTGDTGLYEIEDRSAERDAWIHAIGFVNGRFASISVPADSLEQRTSDLQLRACQGTVTVRVIDDATHEPVRQCSFTLTPPYCVFKSDVVLSVDRVAELSPGLYQFPYGPTAGGKAWIDVSAPGYLVQRSAPIQGDGHVNLSTIEVRLVKLEAAFQTK